jgi:hypothetical protein
LADLQNSENISSADSTILGGGYFDNNITIPVAGVYDYSTTSPYANVTISSGGTSGAVLTTTTSGYNWGSIIANGSQPSLHVTGEAEFENDIKVKGVSISKALDDINKRLAILVPDPEKLEHFEALKKAYEHYKTLEALCQLPKKEQD